MGHLVRYRTAEGELRTDEADNLEAALEQVERLRNQEDVGDVRVYREVPLRFETYVKVRVADDQGTLAETPAGSSTRDEPAPPAAPVEPPPGAMPLTSPPPGEVVNVAERDKRGLFNRS